MKIAIVSGVFFPLPGGVQVQVHNKANMLTNLGDDVDVFIHNKTNIKNNKYKIVLFNKFILNIVFFLNYYLNINFNFILKNYLSSFTNNNYKCWHFHFLNQKSVLILNALKELNKKINYGYRLNKKYNELLKKSLKNVDIFHCISKNIEKDLISIGVKKNKIVSIPNSIYLEKFKKFKKKKINLHKKPIKLITVTRYAKGKKGLDLIFKIVKILFQKKIPFKWILVGQGLEKLKKESDFLKYKANFEIHSNIENINEEYFPNKELFKYYNSSDIYANLARIESFGLTLIEANALGLPVLTFNTKGANEIVKSGYNGMKIENYDFIKFVNHIKKIYNNRKILKHYKKNCFNSINKYNLKKNIIKFKKLIY